MVLRNPRLAATPPCDYFAILGCPSAPYPVQSEGLDWIVLAGPLVGLGLSVAAMWMRPDPAERWRPLYRFVIPIVGIATSLGCAHQIFTWITGAGS